ncbi:S8 family serine peptidase [Solwaraspora sp. WMMD406]|uniref:S8 family serine peptidase n=1 Tax=Solwaraspora sp. WMMD406 TaxID=3016095 RepID=UPI002415F70B|nr:S8 family serine peptidase [Solwaraspora sp. WMMD406]MDG4764534.1 S8 family serine peptidase [Solwaraspora sp. WMMD406]
MSRSRRWLSGAALVLSLLLAGPATTASARPSGDTDYTGTIAADPLRKVDAQVLQPVTGGAEVSFFVELADPGTLDTRELDRVEQQASQRAGGPDGASDGGRAGRVARTTWVYEQKVTHAAQTQRGLRQLLRERGATFTPYWIANVIEVTGDLTLVTELAARPEVARIVPVGRTALGDPVAAASDGTRDGTGQGEVPWNLSQIGADRIWQEYGSRGEGVVVGSIDSGVQHDHPALARQYRGAAGRTVDHTYNWFDPTGICPPGVPCDNYGHGTHTVGTVLGDDGNGTVTGVAPAATWIAAKGCEYDYCTDPSLLAAGQWMVAPTDRDGENPRPDLAPDIINNSWGTDDRTETYYDQIVATWLAAGIFPVFSIGNSGENGCDTAGYPGISAAAYGVGAVDSDGAIGYFSSRGPGPDGAVRPDITAPGVDIWSAHPGGQYRSASGTSMAAPHVSGAVALAWSAVPHLRRDVATTRELLARTAPDVADLTCGGTPEKNNVYGEGHLDAYAMVTAAATGDDGIVRLGRLPAGEYPLTVSFFAQRTQRQTITVPADGQVSTTVDISEPAPWHPVSGTVVDPDGHPVAQARVTLAGESFPGFVTASDGRYSGMLPEADYDVVVDAGRWLAPRTVGLTVDGERTLDVTLEAKTDRHGYAVGVTEAAWTTGGNVLALTGDTASRTVPLPWPVTFYGQTYSEITVHADGYLTFGADPGAGAGAGAGADTDASAAVFAFADDLVLDHRSTVRTVRTGDNPDRGFVISWLRAGVKDSPGTRIDAQVVLGENGTVTVRHRNLDPTSAAGTGGGATVGIQSPYGRDSLAYSVDEPVLDETTAVTFRVPGHGLLRGTVRDDNDRQPLAGATVTVHPSSGPPLTTRADADGFYQLQVPAGEVVVTASMTGYGGPAALVPVGDSRMHRYDIGLLAPLLIGNKAAVSVTARAGGVRTPTVTLTNHGGVSANWTAREIDSPTPPESVPGKVLSTFPLPDMNRAYGIGYRDGELLISNSYFWGQMMRYGTDGQLRESGVVQPMTGWPSDLTYLADRDLMCGPSLSFTGELPIVCFDPDTFEVRETLTGEWAGGYYYGLTYRSSDDTFYLAGNGAIRRLAGFGHDEPGAVLGQCTPAVPWMSGLALNQEQDVLWGINNDHTGEAIWAMDPDSCEILGSIPDPDPDPISGAGLSLDDNGDLWVLGQAATQFYQATAYHVDASLPAYRDVAWLSVAEPSGVVTAGGKGTVHLTIDTAGLAPGKHTATLLIVNDSPKMPAVPVTVTVTVT